MSKKFPWLPDDDDDDGFHFPQSLKHDIDKLGSTTKLLYYDLADVVLTGTHQQTIDPHGNLEPNAHDAHNDMFSGTGNTAADWKIVDNAKAGVELGLHVGYRQGDSITAGATDVTGATHYTVPDGQQITDPAHDVPGDNPNRAAWKVDFSVDSSLGGSTKALDKFDFKLLLDTDPTSGVNFKELHLVNTHGATPDGYAWVDANGNPVIGDGAGNPAHPGQIDQNSMNLDFGYWGGTGAANAPGSQYDVILTAENHNSHQVVAVDHIVLDVVDHNTLLV